MWIDIITVCGLILSDSLVWLGIYSGSAVINLFTYKLRVLSLYDATFSHKEEMVWLVRIFCPVFNTINLFLEPITYWLARYRKS